MHISLGSKTLSKKAEVPEDGRPWRETKADVTRLQVAKGGDASPTCGQWLTFTLLGTTLPETNQIAPENKAENNTKRKPDRLPITNFQGQSC